MSAPTLVTIQSVNPVGTSVTFALLGDSTYGPVSSSASGGWQIVDRPQLPAATQWYDRSPYQLEMPLMIDGAALFAVNGVNIEGLCAEVEGWQDKAPGLLQPAVLAVNGPVPGQQRQWVLYTVSFGEALRDPVAGFRIQQKLQVTLYKYNSPQAAVIGSSTPAAQAALDLAAAEANESLLIYIVSAGDTLSSIAARVMGNYTFWTSLATLNDIRDPNNLSVGQIIKIPQF